MYRLHSKQGQRGIQEAQTWTKSEDHIAHQDDFHFGEKSKERILRRVWLWADTSTKHSSQLQSEITLKWLKMYK